jgi:hypothetical protein
MIDLGGCRKPLDCASQTAVVLCDHEECHSFTGRRDLSRSADEGGGGGPLAVGTGARVFATARLGETEFERLHREELELRQKLLQQPTGFSARDRLSRDELYDRARARREHDEASGRHD